MSRSDGRPQKQLILAEEAYKIIGLCMSVHQNLGVGFLEIVYKDALEYEIKLANIPYEREKKFDVEYKDSILPHRFYADFTVFENIILEVKSVEHIHEVFVAQTLNYLKVSGYHLGIIANFGTRKFEFKRVVL